MLQGTPRGHRVRGALQKIPRTVGCFSPLLSPAESLWRELNQQVAWSTFSLERSLQLQSGRDERDPERWETSDLTAVGTGSRDSGEGLAGLGGPGPQERAYLGGRKEFGEEDPQGLRTDPTGVLP